MKAILAAAVITTLGLGYLAIEPDIVADQLYSRKNSYRPIDEEWLRDARAGVEAGNPYWETSYGLFLLNGSGDREGIEVEIQADPDLAHELIESAVDKGLSRGLFTTWVFTGQTDDVLTRASDLGEPWAMSLTLGRLLQTAECTPEGRAVFTGTVPSREALSRNYSRAVEVYETYSLPDFWGGHYREELDRSYAVLSDMLDRYENGIECTPQPDA